MKSLFGALFVAVGLSLVGSSALAAPSRGSDCADVNLEMTCKGNVLNAVGTLLNCGRLYDTFTTTAIVTDANGVQVANETINIPLGAGRTFSMPYTLNVSKESGTFTIQINTAAQKGTGKDSVTQKLTVPCP